MDAPRIAGAAEDFRLLVASVKDYAIFMLDPEGYVVSWNAGAERLKGYRRHEIIGRHFSTFYRPEELAAGKPETELREALRDGRVEDEGWRVRKDGTEFWANVVITALRDETGTHRGFAKVTRDLTDRRRAEEDRVRLAQTQEAVRLRDDFLAIAAHELRTPLNALSLYLEGADTALRQGKDTVAATLPKARRQVTRLMQLVDRLLDATRISEGRLKLVLEKGEVGEALTGAVEALQDSAERVGSEIALRIHSRVEGFFDRLRIEQVFTNLIENAIKFGRGRPVTIEMRKEGENVAVVTVTDRGPGIDPADAERIFGRFERGSPERNLAGLGLGLYISSRIVDSHGGTIRVESTPGEGATFVVSLPVQR